MRNIFAEKIMAKEKSVYLYYAGIYISLLIITFLWYRDNHWTVMMGDDLNRIGEFRNAGFWNSLVSSESLSLGKVRPVSIVILYAVYLFCGLEYKRYYIITRLFLAAASFIFFIVCKKMGIKTVYAFLIAVLIITCPFSAYGAWQMLGVCEIFSFICCIVCLYENHKIIYESRYAYILKRIVICTVSFTMLILNAERFMYLAVLFCFIVVIKKELSFREKAVSSLIYFLPIIGRSILLNFLGASTLGTGRGTISTLAAALPAHTVKGFVNMLGFSLGDQWHGGFTLSQLPSVVIIISSIKLILFIGIGYQEFSEFKIDKRKEKFEIIAIILFSLSSLFSYALVAETSGEDRFLWISYAFFLTALMKYLSSYICKEHHKIGAVILITLSLLWSDLYYFNNKVHVHFRYSQEMAQTCIDSIKKLSGYKKAANVCCIKPNDYYWVFADQYFFQYYVNSDINVYYYDSAEDMDTSLFSENTIIVFPDANYAVPYGTDAEWVKNEADAEN